MGVDDKIDELLEAQEREEARHLDEMDLGWRDALSLLLFAALFITVFLQFFTRYVLNDSLSFTEELARYLLIILTFVAGIRCQLRDSHIRLEFLDDWAAKYLGALKLFALTLSLIFFSVSFWSLWTLINRTWYQQMISLPFPKYYLYFVVLAAIAITIAVHVWQLYRLVADRKEPKA